MDKIILVGYMGSGKSTVAELLAQKTGRQFIDLDVLIAEREQSSIAELFKAKGEVYFRKAEHHHLKTLMDSNESFVLSVGGGTPCYANNHELLMKAGAFTIYLQTSVDELYERLKSEKFKRPVIAGMPDVELKEFIAKHLFERSFFYNKADLKLKTDGKNPESIVDDIISHLL